MIIYVDESVIPRDLFGCNGLSERNLLAAVLKRALLDLLMTDADNQKWVADAIEWFNEGSPDADIHRAWSFEWVCAELNIDSKLIRRGLYDIAKTLKVERDVFARHVC